MGRFACPRRISVGKLQRGVRRAAILAIRDAKKTVGHIGGPSIKELVRIFSLTIEIQRSTVKTRSFIVCAARCSNSDASNQIVTGVVRLGRV